MSLRKSWLKKEKKGKENQKDEERKEPRDLYKQLKREIPIVREQGEPPQKDGLTFSRYMCDLCSTSFSLSELKQCAVCGKWACSNCWTEKFYVCNSCSGIVALKSIKL